MSPNILRKWNICMSAIHLTKPEKLPFLQNQKQRTQTQMGILPSFPQGSFWSGNVKIQEIYVSHVGVTLQATLKNNLWYKNRAREMESS